MAAVDFTCAMAFANSSEWTLRNMPITPSVYFTIRSEEKTGAEIERRPILYSPFSMA